MSEPYTQSEIDALRENEWLRADNERLRALLQELIDIEGPQPGTSEWARKARAALERKP